MTKKLEKLIVAHKAEALRRRVVIVNLGWFVEKDAIVSKTSDGKFVSYYKTPRTIVHQWKY